MLVRGYGPSMQARQKERLAITATLRAKYWRWR
jgi:hypothetical protein